MLFPGKQTVAHYLESNNDDERATLFSLFQAWNMNSSNSRPLHNWFLHDPETTQTQHAAAAFPQEEQYCDFTGIICNSQGKVILLELPHLNLTGHAIPSSSSSGSTTHLLGALTKLRRLRLMHNSLTGSLPNNGTFLPDSLVHLNLNDNDLTGTLQDVLFPSRLRRLLLSENDLSGTFPTDGTICDLDHLAALHLSHNHILTGRLPACLTTLLANGNLTDIRIHDTHIFGAIPSQLCHENETEQEQVLSNHNATTNTTTTTNNNPGMCIGIGCRPGYRHDIMGTCLECGDDEPSNVVASYSCYWVKDDSSNMPSEFPSLVPSRVPSDLPSLGPSRVPSDFPTLVPSRVPSDFPTLVPSQVPSDVPSLVPSRVPSGFPSLVPSQVQSNVPSLVPSQVPSDVPSLVPSRVPSDFPSLAPWLKPSSSPAPSLKPSSSPAPSFSTHPSMMPTVSPSYRDMPSDKPTTNMNPSDTPTDTDSMAPSTGAPAALGINLSKKGSTTTTSFQESSSSTDFLWVFIVVGSVALLVFGAMFLTSRHRPWIRHKFYPVFEEEDIYAFEATSIKTTASWEPPTATTMSKQSQAVRSPVTESVRLPDVCCIFAPCSSLFSLVISLFLPLRYHRRLRHCTLQSFLGPVLSDQAHWQHIPRFDSCWISPIPL
jgi:hypothetical protein